MKNAAKLFCRRALAAALLFGAAAVLAGCKIQVPKNSPLYHSSSAVSEISCASSSLVSSSADVSKETESSQISDNSASSKKPSSSKPKAASNFTSSSVSSKAKPKVKKQPDTPKNATKSSKTAPAKKLPAQSKSSKKAEEKKQNICTFSIRCDTVFQNMDLLNDATRSQIPKNGIIMAPHTVVLKDGDTVFSVLKRETQSQGIPLNYTKTPGVNTVYVRGIGCLSEFSCGDKSGWQYSVNKQFPMIPCDKYKIKPNESISWQYTCDFGRDLT